MFLRMSAWGDIVWMLLRSARDGQFRERQLCGPRHAIVEMAQRDSLAMSIPDFQSLMLPVLRLAAEGEIRVSDAVDRLASDFKLSPEDRSHLLPSGRQTTFANRVHWAKSYLGKAGLVELTRRAHPASRTVAVKPLPRRLIGSISSSSGASLNSRNSERQKARATKNRQPP